jgi:hypothetical protein
MNVFDGEIASWMFLGDDAEGEVRVRGQLLSVHSNSDVVAQFPVGAAVSVHIPTAHCRLIGDAPDAVDSAGGGGGAAANAAGAASPG